MINGAALDALSLDAMSVDRQGPSRNPATRAVVNASRRRLVAGALPPNVSADALVHRSARLAPGHFAAMAITVALTALVGIPVLHSWEPALWGGLTIALCAMLALLAKARAAGAAWVTERTMQVVHAGLALAWLWFALQDCGPACTGDAPAVYRADALLVGMAVSALVHANVRHALPLTFAPAVAAMALHVEGTADMVGLAMLGMALGGLLLFSFVAARARAAALAALRLEFEKDGLIGDLETANAVSDTARRKAEEANLAKSRFLASMSHELRTPLNAILGFSEMIKDEVLGPVGLATYREYAKDIHTSGGHLLSLINEILDLSRIEAGRYAINPELLQLADVAEGAVSTLRVKAAAKRLDVRVRRVASLSAIVADQRAVQQVMLNLLSNAIKFTPAGGAIEVIVGRTAGGGQYVTVADNGPGIPESELPLVLSAFGQGSIALKAAEQGTGLGLAIVQALVQLHGGRFKLASRLREGTRATFTLPPSPALAGDARPDADAVLGGGGDATRPTPASPAPHMAPYAEAVEVALPEIAPEPRADASTPFEAPVERFEAPVEPFAGADETFEEAPEPTAAVEPVAVDRAPPPDSGHASSLFVEDRAA